MGKKTKQLFYYEWESGASVNVSLFGDIETEKALAILEQFIALKRAELSATTQDSTGSPHVPRS